ncbi:hypothetical protein [Streptomyces buecherae]|uniref:hypothetical protein n=1 Tax=Streptomyces buecherae TaxID=2763006 RepID=UPI0037B424A5
MEEEARAIVERLTPTPEEARSYTHREGALLDRTSKRDEARTEARVLLQMIEHLRWRCDPEHEHHEWSKGNFRFLASYHLNNLNFDPERDGRDLIEDRLKWVKKVEGSIRWDELRREKPGR